MVNNFAASLLLPPLVTKEMTFFRKSNEYSFAVRHSRRDLSKMSTNLTVKYYICHEADFLEEIGVNSYVKMSDGYVSLSAR